MITEKLFLIAIIAMMQFNGRVWMATTPKISDSFRLFMDTVKVHIQRNANVDFRETVGWSITSDDVDNLPNTIDALKIECETNTKIIRNKYDDLFQDHHDDNEPRMKKYESESFDTLLGGFEKISDVFHFILYRYPRAATAEEAQLQQMYPNHPVAFLVYIETNASNDLKNQINQHCKTSKNGVAIQESTCNELMDLFRNFKKTNVHNGNRKIFFADPKVSYFGSYGYFEEFVGCARVCLEKFDHYVQEAELNANSLNQISRAIPAYKNYCEKEWEAKRNIFKYENRFDENNMRELIEKAVEPKEKNEGIVKTLRDIAIEILKESLKKIYNIFIKILSINATNKIEALNMLSTIEARRVDFLAKLNDVASEKLKTTIANLMTSLISTPVRNEQTLSNELFGIVKLFHNLNKENPKGILKANADNHNTFNEFTAVVSNYIAAHKNEVIKRGITLNMDEMPNTYYGFRTECAKGYLEIRKEVFDKLKLEVKLDENRNLVISDKAKIWISDEIREKLNEYFDEYKNSPKEANDALVELRECFPEDDFDNLIDKAIKSKGKTSMTAYEAEIMALLEESSFNLIIVKIRKQFSDFEKLLVENCEHMGEDALRDYKLTLYAVHEERCMEFLAHLSKKSTSNFKLMMNYLETARMELNKGVNIPNPEPTIPIRAPTSPAPAITAPTIPTPASPALASPIAPKDRYAAIKNIVKRLGCFN